MIKIAVRERSRPGDGQHGAAGTVNTRVVNRRCRDLGDVCNTMGRLFQIRELT